MILLDRLTKSYMTSKGRHYLFKDLTIEIPSDKNVALIGKNGAGKSTLLRIMGGIDFPDQGRVVTQKTISWPVGLSGGFQGSLTGRQNVRFVCRLYAQSKHIEEKINFVQNFADIGKYFDMPIKSYSSGMRSRLTFALSMAFDFDYYLIDEVTSVGDAQFRRKCEEVIKERRETSNFIMVSHNLDGLAKQCDVAVVLIDGAATYYADIAEAIEVYQTYALSKK
jgi:capsular polysaccharide transport system ATP-binding protein